MKISRQTLSEVLLNELPVLDSSFSASQQSGIRNSINSIVNFAFENEVDPLENDSEAVSTFFEEWTRWYYKNTHLSDRTAYDYVRAFFRFARVLREKGALPQYLEPVCTRPKQVQPKKVDKDLPALINNKSNSCKSDYTFRCKRRDGKETPAYDFKVLAKYGELGANIVKHLEVHFTNYAYPSIRRGIRIFQQFLSHIEHKQNIDFSCSISMQSTVDDFHYHLFSYRGTKRVQSINDNWMSLYRTIKSLQRSKLFPTVELPKSFSKAQKLAEKNKEAKLLAMALANVKVKDQNDKIITTAFDLRSIPDEVFLDALERDERYVFDTIRTKAIQEVRNAINDYNKGMELVASCNIERIRKIHNTSGKFLDPDIRDNTGRPISFFSNYHPNGLVNILGWIWHEHSGVTTNRCFVGFDFIYKFGGTEKIKNYLGLHHGNALPFFLVIIGETGINVSSLERAKLKDGNDNLILAPTESGKYSRLIVDKPRAGKFISKLVEIDDETNINAYTCLNSILEMTRQYRKKYDLNNLWIGPTGNSSQSKSVITPISEGAFKSNMHKFIKRYDRLSSINSKYITRANIRVSAGVLTWFDSGGDMNEVAKKLGNTINTSIRSYIPEPIRAILHNREIRRFQHILIAVSTKNEETLSSALPELSNEDITMLLHDFKNSQDFKGGSLFEYFENSSTPDSEPKRKLTFCLSKDNIAILYALVSMLHEYRSSHPEIGITAKCCNQEIRYWYELWNAVKASLVNTLDRGQKIIYKEGLSESEDIMSKYELIERDKNLCLIKL